MPVTLVPSPGARALLVAVVVLWTIATAATSRQDAPRQRPQPPPVTETRDPYLNPRETDISLAMALDPDDIVAVAPVEPEKALETFRVKQGFRLELVAHEPDVVDPVQMAFDADGRLYVVEMRWYQSETRDDLMFDERIGRIRLLEDTDGDGQFDRSTIFADKLRYPSAVVPYDGGVYVGLEPDLVFFRDTTGDGVADERRVVFTGFGDHRDRLDSQMFLNSLAWGLDNRIHGAKGHGGFIRALASPGQPVLDLRTRDFSFDPRTHQMRPESGGGKQGLSFDDFGRKFVCTQSTVAQVTMYEDRYSGRNPFYAPPRALTEIARSPDEHPDRQRVERISREDPWRAVRNRWRAEGIFGGPPPQPSGYLTASTGVTVYRGHAFPSAYYGQAFVGASANNLVHRRRIEPDGIGFRATRLAEDAQEEFIASTDMWFRPVAFANGPDGALYIADPYREIIDFSDGVPESIKRVKDLNRGNDRGRIYRVVPEGFVQPARPQVASASTGALVALLAHPNAWHRETASRLIYERQHKGAIPALVDLLRQGPTAVARLHALYALAGLDALAEEQVVATLEDVDAGVREHAVRVSEGFIRDGRLPDALWRALTARVDDEAPRVRYQLAFTLGEVSHPERPALLTALLQHDIDEPWMHVAALTSLRDDAASVLEALAADAGRRGSPHARALLADLMRTIGASGRGRGMLTALEVLDRVDGDADAFTLLAALADGLARADFPLALFEHRLRPLLDRAHTAMRDGAVAEPTRVQAIALVGLASPSASTTETLLSLLAPAHPRAVQAAAIAALARGSDPSLAGHLLARWPRFTPVLRREVLPLLLARPDRALALMAAIDRGDVLRNELTPTQTALLRSSRSVDVRRMAGRVFAAPTAGDRAEAITRYQPSLQLAGDVGRGHDIYRARCASCHMAGDQGHALGPSIDSMRDSALEELLMHIIDPSRAQDAGYRLYRVETRAGDTLMGLIRSETETSVTLAQPFGAEQVLLRANIVRLEGLEPSIMPDGLEEGLSTQDMADLLRFLVSAP